ncbi:hypothetical protein MSTE_00497 [Mycobacteroides stephanolepidis]|uniref:DUF2306 domain-containing protein n=1 Tax=[Mycobacterium] stephanolepidis TaxID=1520670 RepID=A0A1Z4ES96_9MYCO|nr:DUF2306 domain-containing protein [[Mycobacterium] stephanolepidis]BAX95838.1 hypothetical protein MSTE_00497 [[Mycobacterium] stephanolepidis]
MPETKELSISRVFYVATAAVAILYIPLAVNYTWPLFFPGAPRLQDGLNTLINGHAYAVGEGSVEAVRHVDYAQHRTVMAVHTTLGAIALGLAMFQFSTGLRSRYPAAHRWMGRAYLALMSVSMLTAIIFLVAAPYVGHFIGRAFDLQLWALALGTLGSSWFALYAIRNRDVITHRAWMGYGIALMMTAPLLRVLWIGLQPIVPQHDLLTNLGASAIVLGVAAPFGAAAAFVLTQPVRARVCVPSSASSTYAWIVGVAVLGSAGYAALASRLPDSIPRSLAAYHVVPVWIAIVITLTGVWHARVRDDGAREQRWRWLLCGVASAPVAACLTVLVSAPVYTAPDAVIAGGMVGAPGPIAVAFALIVYVAARRVSRPTAQPQDSVPSVREPVSR